MADPKAVPVESLTLEQLAGLKRNLNDKLEQLGARKQLLKQLSSHFENSKSAISNVQGSEGAEILVPLSQSVYVPGRQGSTKTFLVDVGTNYYVQKNEEGAKDFCDRKVKLLDTGIAETSEGIKNTLQISERVEFVIREKLLASQQQSSQTKV